MYIKRSNTTIINNIIVVLDIKKNKKDKLFQLGVIDKSFIVELEQVVGKKIMIKSLN